MLFTWCWFLMASCLLGQWTEVYSVSNGQILGTHFYNDSCGVIAFDDYDAASPIQGRVVYTQDYGNTWDTLLSIPGNPLPFPMPMWDAKLLSATVWQVLIKAVGGQSARWYQSFNSGETWNYTSVPGTGSFNSFISNNQGEVVVMDNENEPHWQAVSLNNGASFSVGNFPLMGRSVDWIDQQNWCTVIHDTLKLRYANQDWSGQIPASWLLNSNYNYAMHEVGLTNTGEAMLALSVNQDAPGISNTVLVYYQPWTGVYRSILLPTYVQGKWKSHATSNPYFFSSSNSGSPDAFTYLTMDQGQNWFRGVQPDFFEHVELMNSSLIYGASEDKLYRTINGGGVYEWMGESSITQESQAMLEKESRLFPNPGVDHVSFPWEDKPGEIIQVKAIQMLGSQSHALTFTTNENMLFLDTSALTSGIYFIQTVCSERTETLGMWIRK